eukprot:366203-Chlamydomonas_euryale.AAC.5
MCIWVSCWDTHTPRDTVRTEATAHASPGTLQLRARTPGQRARARHLQPAVQRPPPGMPAGSGAQQVFEKKHLTRKAKEGADEPGNRAWE